MNKDCSSDAFAVSRSDPTGAGHSHNPVVFNDVALIDLYLNVINSGSEDGMNFIPLRYGAGAARWRGQVGFYRREKPRRLPLPTFDTHSHVYSLTDQDLSDLLAVLESL